MKNSYEIDVMAHYIWHRYSIGGPRNQDGTRRDHVYGACSACGTRWTMYGDAAGYPKCCPECTVAFNEEQRYAPDTDDALTDLHNKTGQYRESRRYHS